MRCVDDMRNYIQEWFADAGDHIEVAKTYHEVISEAERQLEYMTAELSKKEAK